MTNKEEGVELINQATRIFKRDVTSALRDADYNLVVRRSQEVVELALKGALKILGIDYPKVHHVGDIFRKTISRKGVKITDEVCQKIERISLWLSETREPSFYFERRFRKEDGLKARKDAGFVMREIKKDFRNLSIEKNT
ncbi:MAG: HEPN domain-containing protein [Candidatus Edwardsbacteria bacterium]